MKTIILAAGYGNRMRPLSDATHKTLLKIGNKPVIARIIDSLSKNNIHNIVIVTGYRDKELKNFVLTNFPDLHFQFIHNERYQETNNIYSLSLAFQSIEIDDDIILIESDLVYEPAIIQRLINVKKDNIALVDKFRTGMDGTVVTVKDNIITNIIPPHLQGADFDFSDKYKSLNIYKFSKDFCNSTFKRLLVYYSNVFDKNCYYELILGILIYVQKEIIYAEILEGEKWTEIDDPNDISIAKFMFDTDHQFEVLENNFGGLWNHDVLDFCYIRNMYFPNNSILAEMKNNFDQLVHNYGTRQDTLNEKLAYFLLLNQNHLNVLNGLSQIYPLLKKHFDGKKVLIPEPTFGEYPRIFGDKYTYTDKVGINTSELEEKAQQCQAVVFVNPNNPTGSLIQTEKIIKFAQNNKDKTILVDESFIEFSDQNSITSFLQEKPLNNVIALKSLSKSLGIPGLRLGYAYSSNDNFNKSIRQELPIWNINSIAEFFLEIILKHRDSLKQSFQRTIADREHFIENLKELPFLEHVYPSGGNFILIQIKSDTVNIDEIPKLLLSSHSIYIKNVSHKFKDNNYYFRLAVRHPKENDYLIQSLKETIKY